MQDFVLVLRSPHGYATYTSLAVLCRSRAADEKSLETLEALTNDKAAMESQLSMQQKQLASMHEDLAGTKERWAAGKALAETRGAEIAELKARPITDPWANHRPLGP
ncbi:hypothetical protein PLESTM_000277400 [Pleodorina starrii]|nr:hypothetical protein PLESTM_000277400 [Pleodorina starrii]